MIHKHGAVLRLVMKQMDRTVQFRQIKFTKMDDEMVSINNGELVIRVVGMSNVSIIINNNLL